MVLCTGHQKWKTAINTLLMFGYCVVERVSQQAVLRYGSCISVKIASFCLLRRKFETGLESGGVEERKHEKPIQSKGVPNQFRDVE